jgi:hypothetical protein
MSDVMSGRVTGRRGALLFLRLALAVTLGGSMAAACGGDGGSGPPTVVKPSGDLQIVRRTSNAPPLVANSASFWAVRGQDRELRMFYRSNSGGGNGAEFLRLRVNKLTLDRRPDGSAIALGDSVLITVTADPTLVAVDFQPTGLRFSTVEPAELKLRWAEGDDDLNHDGRVDSSDDALRQQLAIWTHEGSNDPWTKLATDLRLDVEEAEARLRGFSGFAVAY